MWLNVFIMGFASLFVGFILGWIMGRPRRWDSYVRDIDPRSPAATGPAPSGPASARPASPASAGSDGLAPPPVTLTTHG